MLTDSSETLKRLEIWKKKTHLNLCMGLNGGSVAMDSEERDDCHAYCTVQSHRREKLLKVVHLYLAQKIALCEILFSRK
jgi:hypothetical protein